MTQASQALETAADGSLQALQLTEVQSETIVEMRKSLLVKLGKVYDERRQLHLQVCTSAFTARPASVSSPVLAQISIWYYPHDTSSVPSMMIMHVAFTGGPCIH